MSRNLFSKCILGCGLAVAVLVPLGSVHAQGFSVLYSFCPAVNCPDGANPFAGLIIDKKGNLYGTAAGGGADGAGVVFKLAPDGTETVLYSFTVGSDGFGPTADLIMDSSGNLYSTTENGGADGYGVVFKLAPDGTETVLYSFTGGSDGKYPEAGLIMDSSGNLYSTTLYGGADKYGADKYGVVFKLAPDGTETVLYSFTGGSDGEYPQAGLIMDSSGNLYGTTERGGAYDDGVVFKLAPGGTETVLYSFTGSDGGAYPYAGLIMGSSGNLYGMTPEGGAYDHGVVFKLAPGGTETVLHSFTGGSDGSEPQAGLIMGRKGNLYGTTYFGGTDGAGVVFKLASDGKETVLHSFTGGDGVFPSAGLLMDKKGNLYSTTQFGGAYESGVVFTLQK